MGRSTGHGEAEIVECGGGIAKLDVACQCGDDRVGIGVGISVLTVWVTAGLTFFTQRSLAQGVHADLRCGLCKLAIIDTKIANQTNLVEERFITGEE